MAIRCLSSNLTKTRMLAELGLPRFSRLTPSLLLDRGIAMGLDMKINVAIVRKCTGLLTESSSLLRDSRSDGAGTLSFFRHEDVRPHSVQNGRQDL